MTLHQTDTILTIVLPISKEAISPLLPDNFRLHIIPYTIRIGNLDYQAPYTKFELENEVYLSALISQTNTGLVLELVPTAIMEKLIEARLLALEQISDRLKNPHIIWQDDVVSVSDLKQTQEAYPNSIVAPYAIKMDSPIPIQNAVPAIIIDNIETLQVHQNGGVSICMAYNHNRE